MAVTKSKKQATKGSKQIIEDNDKTIQFYMYISSGALIIYFIVMLTFFMDSFTSLYIVLSILNVIIHVVCHKLLRYAAKVTYTEDGKVLDCGTDLNMEGGIAEHVKDLIILTGGSQLLSLISNYFWFLMLLVPFQALFLTWKNILAPWFFQTDEKTPEVEDKKKKKSRYN